MLLEDFSRFRVVLFLVDSPLELERRFVTVPSLLRVLRVRLDTVDRSLDVLFERLVTLVLELSLRVRCCETVPDALVLDDRLLLMSVEEPRVRLVPLRVGFANASPLRDERFSAIARERLCGYSERLLKSRFS